MLRVKSLWLVLSVLLCCSVSDCMLFYDLVNSSMIRFMVSLFMCS